jgi:hypothetical protein
MSFTFLGMAVLSKSGDKLSFPAVWLFIALLTAIYGFFSAFFGP